MKISRLPLALAVVLALGGAAGAVLAQASAPMAPPPASGVVPPPAAKPGPRALSPAELRDSSTPLDESQPQGKVVPQISIPLGQPATAPLAPAPRPARRSASAAATGVSDAAARCEAQADEQMRVACRARLRR